MPTITVSKRLEVPAAAVWEILADFGNVDWLPGPPDVTVVGEGPGMQRLITGSADAPIVETLVWIKPQERSLSYEITNNPLPVSRFVAIVTVDENPDAQNESTVIWHIDYQPAGDDAAARDAIEAVYGLMAGWFQDFARTRGAA